MREQSDPSQRNLPLEVLQQFRIIYGSMRAYFKHVEERCGIPGSHTWVLQELERTPGIGVSELARRMGIHQSTSSLLVDKLVAQGYLGKNRNPTDLRRVGLELSEKGKIALASLPGPAEGILPEALASLPEIALITLNIHLRELIENLHEKDESFAATPLAEMLDEE